MIWGWGTKTKKYLVENNQVLIHSWKYFSLFFIPIIKHSHQWILLGENRSEDKLLTEEQVLRMFPAVFGYQTLSN